jgi:hypothetical protein
MVSLLDDYLMTPYGFLSTSMVRSHQGMPLFAHPEETHGE